MRTLTTADVAFLLCTSQRQQAGHHHPKLQLTLETTYGLVIDINADGSVVTRLNSLLSESSSSSSEDDEIEPVTPIQASSPVSLFSRPRAFFPASSSPCAMNNNTNSIDEILCTPISPATADGDNFLLRAAFSSQKIIPSSQPLKRKPFFSQQQNGYYQYRIQPDWHDPLPSYVSYAPTATEDEEPVAEDDLEARYGSEWFDAYLDWVDRLEEALHRSGHRDWGFEFRNPFSDEGVRTLWMVEGLLLASWLGLQSDVGGVEYQPGKDVFMLPAGEGGRIDGVLAKLLGMR
ncbi:hypothetical protein QBC47DRAFT_462848 [Echria macrotheca]|uniref:Uncharacterized protein n=1 Tax=Echria macrotheca TaxID=438768 RepID=A0AAJ0F390_9PEZI|nr:hypothetical protein QBC47DRAFT_462848 [Echria macrotheca]